MGQQKAALLIILLLAILGVGAWQLFLMNSKQDTAAASVEVSTQHASQPMIAIELPLEVRHSVKNGTHTYSGSITLPNACDTLSNGIAAQWMKPPHIRIQLSSEKMTCASGTKTKAEFSVSFNGGKEKENPVIDAITFNDMEIPYTVVEE